MPNSDEQFTERPDDNPKSGPVIVSREHWEKLRELTTEASFDALAISQAVQCMKIAMSLNSTLPVELKGQYLALMEAITVAHGSSCKKMMDLIDVLVEAEGLD